MTESKPDLSIIVPVYKAEKFLRECVESILAQTFRDYELILIDDGSPDASGKICDEYALKDNRVKVIHQQNGGASAARNRGVAASKGKYIGWVDADDRIAPEMFDKLVRLIKEYRADIAECQYTEIFNNTYRRSGDEEKIISGNGDFIMHEFFGARMKPGLTTKLYRRELWNDTIFPLGRIHQDCYVNMRFSLMPLTYVRTPEPLYYYLVRSNSITTTHSEREIREAIYLYEYTLSLKASVAATAIAKELLERDAVNRLVGRYYELSVNGNIRSLKIYNHLLRKKLGKVLIKYLLTADLPLKTRISYSLCISNLNWLQSVFHKLLGTKSLKPEFSQ